MLYGAGFAHQGHTDFLAHVARQKGQQARPVMMLVAENLRTVPVTIHIALKDVVEALSSAAITEQSAITARDLQRYFGVAGPRLAITGLNPHAGEGGTIGDEEATIIVPAIEELRRRGIQATGPYPADTIFHASARKAFRRNHLHVSRSGTYSGKAHRLSCRRQRYSRAAVHPYFTGPRNSPHGCRYWAGLRPEPYRGAEAGPPDGEMRRRVGVMNTTLPPLREVISRHGLSARRSLGQNFLLDLNLTRRIARAAQPLAEQTIIEVGPGPGGLTRALLSEGAGRVVAVERDPRALPAISEIAAAYPGRVDVVCGDALETNWAALARGPTKVVANLPYNIATPLLVEWLTVETWPPWYQSLTLMFQKEVAQRITAGPGSKVYGRLSVLAQWRTKAVRLFDIGPRAFTPAPKVTSSLVQITPKQPIESSCQTAVLEEVTRLAFGQRRKKLRSSLKAISPDPVTAITFAGIDANARAEELPVADFCRLATVLGQIRQSENHSR